MEKWLKKDGSSSFSVSLNNEKNLSVSQVGRLDYAGLAIILWVGISRGGILCKWQRSLNFISNVGRISSWFYKISSAKLNEVFIFRLKIVV